MVTMKLSIPAPKMNSGGLWKNHLILLHFKKVDYRDLEEIWIKRKLEV